MPKQIPYLVAALVIILAGFLIFKGSSKGVQPMQTNNQPTTAQSQPTVEPTTAPSQPMVIDRSKTYTAVLKTSVGDITIALNADKTPITVNNFVTLAQKKFYDNTIFHRVIKGFMIQGGDPEGTGRGGPGYRFDDEPFDGEYTRGTIAMGERRSKHQR